ncbi:MAG TPA: helix-turn-helix transcriptional regulator [Thermoanaerobaculia bacterium]|nr:helix-turn-helix transcriptional regulator [Thermoanaerobaculia bacterium]
MDPETDRLVNLLKVSLKILGITNREVARRLEMSPSYISKLLSGASELRLDHVIRICRAAGIEPAEFFALAYPRQPMSSLAASKLRDLLQNVQQQPQALLQPQPAPPPAAQVPVYSEAQLQEMLKVTLEKMLGRSIKG